MTLHAALRTLQAASIWIIAVCALPANCQTPALPQVVAGGTDQNIHIIDKTGKPAQSFLAHDGTVNCLVITPEGRIISGGEDKIIKVWNSDGQLETTLDPTHEKAVLSLAVSPNGKILATGGADNKIKLWNPMTGRLLITIPAHAGPVRTLAWSPDGNLLASGSSDRLIQVWRPDGRNAGTIIGHDEPVTALAWTRDSRTLISGAADGYLLSWDIGNFSSRARVRAHQKAVTAIALAPDGKTLATAGSDGRIRLWTVNPTAFAEGLSASQEKTVACLAWGLDGSVLVSGGADKMVRYWNGKDLTPLHKVSVDTPITALAVNSK